MRKDINRIHCGPGSTRSRCRGLGRRQYSLGRAGTADEIAKAVLFPAPDDSIHVTGIELFVDGSLAQR
jgi:NAD(P)-dependent dehydrogenase (short-subunit alcohol dehydrogenase family)